MSTMIEDKGREKEMGKRKGSRERKKEKIKVK